jgi:hypothetical protein
LGFANRKNPENPDSIPNACWLLADEVAGITTAHLLGTAGHEIGHILVGYNHPDDPRFPGKAHLPKTDHRKRLMVGGEELGGAVRTGKILVKKEWEEAEIWLRKFIDTPEPEQ